MRLFNIGHRAVLALVVGASFCAAFGTSAHAYDQQFSPAQVCTPLSHAGGNADLSYSVTGVIQNLQWNTGTGAAGGINCGVNREISANDTDDDVIINYDDANGNADAGAPWDVDVLCNASGLDATATSLESPTARFGCSTAGGCTSGAGSGFTGSNTIAFDNLDHGPARSIAVYCTIPSRPTSGGAVSSLLSVTLDED